ncbi:MAG TPA: hypothetical protein VGJ44_25000 [Kribbellaceae bacterium]
MSITTTALTELDATRSSPPRTTTRCDGARRPDRSTAFRTC